MKTSMPHTGYNPVRANPGTPPGGQIGRPRASAPYMLNIHPVPAMTYLALVPVHGLGLPLLYARCHDSQIDAWKAVQVRRTPTGAAYLRLTVGGEPRQAVFQPARVDGQMHTGLTDAVRGITERALIRQTLDPASRAASAWLETPVRLTLAQNGAWDCYQIDRLEDVCATPPPAKGPRRSRRPSAIWI